MAAIQPGVWGIDLGQCALKALRVENIEGQVTATAFDYVEHPKILSQPDADPEQLTREALEKFLSRNTLKGDVVVISIPGQSGLARFVKLPPVEEKKITDIVRFEAKQQIPFNLEEVVWDYQKLGSGVVTDGFAMETEIGLFAIKRDTVNRYLQHFKDVGVEVHVVQMAPLALCNYVAYDLLEKMENAEGEEDDAGKKRCIVALDIGADNSNLVITDGQRIIWQRPIPLGGNHFTRVLTKDMKLTFAKAEHLKRNAIKSADLKQILSSLKPVLNDFVGEVQRSLGYFTNTHRDAHVQYMIGLGNAFRLPGLQKFLGEKLQLDVRKLQKLERLAGDTVTTTPVYNENVLSFAVAYGLALQGLKVSRLHTNLLPQDIQVERLIRAKKPWAVTAAAALLLGTGALATGYQMQYRAVAAPPVKDAIKGGKSVETTYKKFQSDVDKIKGEIQKDSQAVLSIVSGQDERLNWLRFHQFINDAVPEPDASNLSDDVKKAYWDNDPRAKAAFERFKKQQGGAMSEVGPKGDEETWRNDLIQVNIESVYCVWCQYLKGFHDRLLARDTVQAFTMDKAERETPPKDKEGWVVEVRGYTYHRDPLKFLNEVVVDNFRRKGRPAAAAAAPAGGGNPTTAQPNAKQPPPGPVTKPPDPGPQAVPTAANPDDPISISYVVLLDFKTENNPELNRLTIADKSIIDGLTMGLEQPGDPNAPRPGGIGGGKSTTNSSWSPLTSPSGSGDIVSPIPAAAGERGNNPQDNPAQQPGTGPANNPATPPPQMGGTPGQMGSARAGAGKKDTSVPVAPDKMKKSDYARTEFVIAFVWKEATPSDSIKPVQQGPPAKKSMFGGTAVPPGGFRQP